MNDPVLNRKMFRHAAQIKHNQIPKYQIGTPPGGVPQSPFTMGGMQQAAGSAIPRRNFLKDSIREEEVRRRDSKGKARGRRSCSC